MRRESFFAWIYVPLNVEDSLEIKKRLARSCFDQLYAISPDVWMPLLHPLSSSLIGCVLIRHIKDTEEAKLFFERQIKSFLEVMGAKVAYGVDFISTRIELERIPQDSLEASLWWVDPFCEDDGLRKEMKQSFTVLHALGIRSLHALMEELRQRPGGYVVRFGEWIHVLKSNYLLRYQFVWPRSKPSQELTLKYELQPDEVTSDKSVVLFLMKRWAEEVCSTARSRNQSISVVSLALEQDDGPGRVRTLCVLEAEFFYPTDRSKLVFKHLEAQYSAFETKHEENRRTNAEFMERPFVGIQGSWVEVSSDAADSDGFFLDQKSAQIQKKKWGNFVSTLQSKKNIQSLYGLSTLDRRFPEDAVEYITGLDLLTPMKDTGQKKSLRFPERPLRLFPEPYVIQRVGCYLKCSIGQWRIKQILNTECIHKDWWNMCAHESRTYYAVLTDSGIRLWIFKSNHKDIGIFLHGIF